MSLGGEDGAWASVAALAELADPFESTVWPGIAQPVRAQDIEIALDEAWFTAPGRRNLDCGYWEHVRRIAYLAAFGWEDPIEIDVGVPGYDCANAWPNTDGNHRFAAALCLGHSRILAQVNGDLDYAASLGLLARC